MSIKSCAISGVSTPSASTSIPKDFGMSSTLLTVTRRATVECWCSMPVVAHFTPQGL